MKTFVLSSTRFHRWISSITAALCVTFAIPAGAQIPIPGASAATENFDSLGNTTATLPANWKISAAGAASPTWGGAGNFTAVTAATSTGSPTTGARYNWGNGTTTTDRAVGFMTSDVYASPNSVMACYVNNTGSIITALAISFDIERYRINTAAASVTFFTSPDGTTWTAQTAGDSGAFATGTSAYNFSTGTVVSKSFILTGLSITNATPIYLRWNFNTTGSNSQGLGLDNVSLTATENPDILSVALNVGTIVENSTNPATTGTITRSGSTAAELIVNFVSDDLTEASVPATVTIPAGSASAPFDVTAVNDTFPDGDQTVTLTATAGGYATGTATLTVQDDGDPWPVVISQYYEGAGNDKYIELHNISASPITLTNYRLCMWTNASTENWKTNTGLPYKNSALSGITIPGNSYWLLKDTGAVNPAYANIHANTAGISAVGDFNGGDSVVLYYGSTNAVSNIVDAVSFTNLGNEGADKSFYRLSNATGYDLTAGTSVLTYPTVWGSKTLAEVAAAASTDDWYLNYYTIPMVPTLATFSAGNGAVNTASGRVSLNFTTTDGIPLEFRVSETADLSDAAWQPVSSLPSCDVSAGTSTKTVYFQVKNDIGSSAILSDAIERVAPPYTPTVLITQYYDPDSLDNKYLEITNTTASPVNMNGWVIGRWTNQDAEHWKITGASASTTPNGTIELTKLGTLPAGQTVVIAHTGAAVLSLAAALTSGNLSQTGNDSLALYNGTPSPETLADVVSFSYLGNEGADKSFVRLTNAQGFSFAANSTITDFPAVWQETALATVAAAGPSANEKLGVYPGSLLPAGYDSWNDNLGNQTPDQDYDGDGLNNGIEYFMGTLGNSFTPNPAPLAGVMTWPRANGTMINSWSVEVSTDLKNWENANVHYASNLDTTDPTKLVFTMPTSLNFFFVRLSVTP